MKYLLGFLVALVAILGGAFIWITWFIFGLLVKGLLLSLVVTVVFFGFKAIRDDK